jgi:hypothetical protein
MKRFIVALLAVIFVVSTAAIVSAKCGKTGCCGAAKAEGGCQKADPNSK